MQLNPRESFTIVRQIEDHTDTNTYYVRAVVRNAKTDVLLATVNLTDRGSQRFSKDYLVPADASGNGLWISITTSVYTDSGYTTKSANYGDRLDIYLVQERYQFNPNYPSGPDIDYKRIKKIVDETVSEKIKDIDFPEPLPPKEVNFSPVIKAIKDIDIPKPQEVDLGPVITKLEDLGRSVIKEIKKLPQDYQNLSWVDVSIGNVIETLTKKIDEINKLINSSKTDKEKRLAEALGVIMTDVTKPEVKIVEKIIEKEPEVSPEKKKRDEIKARAYKLMGK